MICSGKDLVSTMNDKSKRELGTGVGLLVMFLIWTLLIQIVDVQKAGPEGTDVGFANINVWFHQMTGVHMKLYVLTDWMGLIPVFVCLGFGILGLVQWIRRRRIRAVDFDILLLGFYYVFVILAYFIFEMVPINFRPILIDGRLEASYPSSTTLLVLSVMPTLLFQINRKIKRMWFKKIISILTIIFISFMIGGRLISGVHWMTDIIGAIFLSSGLFSVYKGSVILYET